MKILPERGLTGIDVNLDFDVDSRIFLRVVAISRKVCAVRVGASWITALLRYIGPGVVETGLILPA